MEGGEEPAPIEVDEAQVINIGWHWSENKQEWQMAKIKEKDRLTHFYVIDDQKLSFSFQVALLKDLNWKE